MSIFFNGCFDKGQLKNLVAWFLNQFGEKKTIDFLETLKQVGFHEATQAGISLGLEDLQIPTKKPILISNASIDIKLLNQNIAAGNITSVEKSQRIIDTWNQTSELLRQTAVQNFRITNPVNPVYMMAFSGARGNISQVRQLVAMRGLMADPQGAILEFPIQSNFREGLTLTEYLISCYGARKGLVDTALRTATSGYLTRRLVDAVQHIVITIKDCKTTKGFLLKEKNLESRLIGRAIAQTLILSSSETIEKNHLITKLLARKIAVKYKSVLIRSPLTCKAYKSICQLCYGWNMSHGSLVNIGEAVGVIAAQSIGEPGTQLTMRTFHTGGVGVFSDQALKPFHAPFDGLIEFPEPLTGHFIRTPYGKIVYMVKYTTHLNSLVSRQVMDENTKSNFDHRAFNSKPQLPLGIGEYKTILKIKPLFSSFNSYEIKEQDLPPGSLLLVRQGEKVKINQLVAQSLQIQTSAQTLPESIHPVQSDLTGEIFFESIVISKQKQISALADIHSPKQLKILTKDSFTNNSSGQSEIKFGPRITASDGSEYNSGLIQFNRSDLSDQSQMKFEIEPNSELMKFGPRITASDGSNEFFGQTGTSFNNNQDNIIGPDIRTINQIGTFWIFSSENHHELHTAESFLQPGDLVSNISPLFEYHFHISESAQLRKINSKLSLGIAYIQIPIKKVSFYKWTYCIKITLYKFKSYINNNDSNYPIDNSFALRPEFSILGPKFDLEQCQVLEIKGCFSDKLFYTYSSNVSIPLKSPNSNQHLVKNHFSKKKYQKNSLLWYPKYWEINQGGFHYVLGNYCYLSHQSSSYNQKSVTENQLEKINFKVNGLPNSKIIVNTPLRPFSHRKLNTKLLKVKTESVFMSICSENQIKNDSNLSIEKIENIIHNLATTTWQEGSFFWLSQSVYNLQKTTKILFFLKLYKYIFNPSNSLLFKLSLFNINKKLLSYNKYQQYFYRILKKNNYHVSPKNFINPKLDFGLMRVATMTIMQRSNEINPEWNFGPNQSDRSNRLNKIDTVSYKQITEFVIDALKPAQPTKQVLSKIKIQGKSGWLYIPSNKIDQEQFILSTKENSIKQKNLKQNLNKILIFLEPGKIFDSVFFVHSAVFLEILDLSKIGFMKFRKQKITATTYNRKISEQTVYNSIDQVSNKQFSPIELKNNEFSELNWYCLDDILNKNQIYTKTAYSLALQATKLKIHPKFHLIKKGILNGPGQIMRRRNFISLEKLKHSLIFYSFNKSLQKTIVNDLQNLKLIKNFEKNLIEIKKLYGSESYFGENYTNNNVDIKNKIIVFDLKLIKNTKPNNFIIIQKPIEYSIPTIKNIRQRWELINSWNETYASSYPFFNKQIPSNFNYKNSPNFDFSSSITFYNKNFLSFPLLQIVIDFDSHSLFKNIYTNFGLNANSIISTKTQQVAKFTNYSLNFRPKNAVYNNDFMNSDKVRLKSNLSKQNSNPKSYFGEKTLIDPFHPVYNSHVLRQRMGITNKAHFIPNKIWGRPDIQDQLNTSIYLNTLRNSLNFFFYDAINLKNRNRFIFEIFKNGWVQPSTKITTGFIKLKTSGQFRRLDSKQNERIVCILRYQHLLNFDLSKKFIVKADVSKADFSSYIVPNSFRIDNRIEGSNSNFIWDQTSDHTKLKILGQSKQDLNNLKVGQLVRKGQELIPGVIASHSGQIIGNNGKTITIRLGIPILASVRGILHVAHGDLIDKNNLLVTLKSRRLQTEDIVQGIPKIEQLFEARETRAGELISNNVHSQLQNYFIEALNLRTLELAVQESIRQIQTFLVENIVEAYSNQGVKVSDIHAEVLVREMTTRVRILAGGDTGLLSGEFVELIWVEEVNHHLQSLHKQQATYEPIVLGITKSILQSESFLLAASFQEVSRVLVRSALNRKADFLRGLHENVIVGELIPAGTGLFNVINSKKSLTKT